MENLARFEFEFVKIQNIANKLFVVQINLFLLMQIFCLICKEYKQNLILVLAFLQFTLQFIACSIKQQKHILLGNE